MTYLKVKYPTKGFVFMVGGVKSKYYRFTIKIRWFKIEYAFYVLKRKA